MSGLIDLNVAETEEDETPSYNSLSPSSSSVSGLSVSPPPAAVTGGSAAGSTGVSMELWHACAGPLISLPKKGSVVVYIPQGHLEHSPDRSAATYGIPPHVFCRVVDVKLHADTSTDEVFAQVSLLPEPDGFEERLQDGTMEADLGEEEEEDEEAATRSNTPHMFCKTLTASDTSTHGGFSVPRRAAEDCFPPLDYSQQRPSQEIVAKDLHGREWRFRHIYRGQPRRHLLTTGWSAFVNKKKLVSGDAVLFLLGEDGELRLGVRRALQMKGRNAFSIPYGQRLNYNSFAEVIHAITSQSVFSIYYNPKVSWSEYIIPVQKFLKSVYYPFAAGMRFKLRVESEDAAERRCLGIITGISDADPIRWPGSKWKCLLVRWDVAEPKRRQRFSPWEIEPSGSVSNPYGFISTGPKRSRIEFPSGKSNMPVPDGSKATDFGESLRFQRVLQGQEIPVSNAASNGTRTNCHNSFHPSGKRFSGANSSFPPISSYKGMSFSESLGFRKVLQGQEIHPNLPSLNGVSGFSDGVQGLSQRNVRSGSGQTTAGHVSSPSSVLAFQKANNNSVSHFDHPCRRIDYPEERLGDRGRIVDSNFQNGVSRSICKNSCRLFGFSLTEESQASGNRGVFGPCVDEQRPEIANSVAGRKVYTVRDVLLDIAL